MDNRKNRIDRPKRIPLGSPRLKLKVDEDPSVVRYWFNDNGNRLSDAIDAGYRHVQKDDVEVGTPDVGSGNTDLGSCVSVRAGTNDDGSPLRSYLMEIPKELYLEDQAAKEAKIKETERSILSGNIDGNAQDGRYIPSQGIRLRA